MNGTAFGQYVPKESGVHRLDPRTKILLATILLISVIILQTWQGCLLLGLFTAGVMIGARIHPIWYFKNSGPLMMLILLTAFLQMILTPGKVLMEWGIITITLPGVKMGLLMGYRLLMVYILAQLLTRTTSPMQMTDGVEKLLNPFKKLGLPVHEFAMIAMIALRFIPVVFEESDRIMRAQKSRGADFEGSSLTHVSNLVAILVPLFTRTFRRADELAVAMEIRCYTGSKGRTRLNQTQMGSNDYMVIFSASLIAVAAILL